ncbi:uncharacterized protein LOC114259017 [Camellia sinensis]|uniref:uncharacterized protein LOC114259017 n=1 Tax=Camellia sinensis TaxID=4442 RepID=UPI001036EFCD|nr:uncharacterized protein LOC114259017 [Camellia sinensis]
MGSELVAYVIVERVHDKPLTRLTNVKYDFKKAYGLQISCHVAWLGVEKARGELYGDHSVSFDQLHWYSDAVMEYNPRSYINLDFDEHNTRLFNRLFISFKACMDGFNHCCPLLFLDGTFLKGRFKGNLLVVTGKDGNLGLFPVAFAIVDSENAANWAWFLQNLANVVDRDRNLTFVSDRHVGIIESLPTIFQSAHHAFCMQHLQRNLKDNMKYVNKLYRIGLVSKLRECAYAPTVADFNEKIEAFI